LPRRPRVVDDLLSSSITSGEVVDPSQVGLFQINDPEFLVQLAHALDAVVVAVLDMARRIGWDEKHRPWKIGLLNRVYFVSDSQRPVGEHEPDEFHRGIAPSVKLLHFVVSRLCDLDLPAALEFERRWKENQSSIHLRLWAASARDRRFAPASAYFRIYHH
jgi:hypothetical protein